MKYNRVDIIAVDEKGSNIIIEVQYSPEKYYFKRLLFGTCKDIIDNIKVGEDYSNVKKVYSVSLIYFDVEDHSKDSDSTDYVYHGKLDFTGMVVNKFTARPCIPEYFIISMEIFNNQVDDLLDE